MDNQQVVYRANEEELNMIYRFYDNTVYAVLMIIYVYASILTLYAAQFGHIRPDDVTEIIVLSFVAIFILYLLWRKYRLTQVMRAACSFVTMKEEGLLYDKFYDLKVMPKVYSVHDEYLVTNINKIEFKKDCYWVYGDIALTKHRKKTSKNKASGPAYIKIPAYYKDIYKLMYELQKNI